MADDTLQRLFQNLQGTRRQQSLTGNYQSGYAQTYAPYDAYFANARQGAKESKGLALQERGVVTAEKAQAAQASQFAQSLAQRESEFGQQQSMYNKALSQQDKWAKIGLGAQALGAGATMWAAQDRTNMMRDIYGRGGTPALTQDQQVNYPVGTQGQFDTWVTSPTAEFTPATYGGQTYAKYEPSMGGAGTSSVIGDLFAAGGALSWANFWD